MTEIELTIKALEEGILPAFSGDELAKLFESCDPDQARKMKRKFRKLWRKEMRKSLDSATSPAHHQRIVDSFRSAAVRRRSVRKNLMSE